MVSKKTIAQLLLIFFSVILGHQWIPHHHHAEVLATAANPSCPLDHQDQHTSGEHPFHCHAFNELAFFKEDPSDHLNQIQETKQQDAITVFSESGYSLQLTGQVRSALSVSCTAQDPQDPVPARGPPASA